MPKILQIYQLFHIWTYVIFGQLGWNILWQLNKLLSIDCWCEINVMAASFRLSDFDFWGPFWHLRVWGFRTRPESWPTLGPFWSLVISKSCPQTFWPWTPLKGAGGLQPDEGRNRVFCWFWQMGVSAIRCILPDQKILFLAEVIKFWNTENTGNFSLRTNFKHVFPKMDIFVISKSIYSYIFWDKCLKLESYVLVTKTKLWRILGYRQFSKFNITSKFQAFISKNVG